MELQLTEAKRHSTPSRQVNVEKQELYNGKWEDTSNPKSQKKNENEPSPQKIIKSKIEREGKKKRYLDWEGSEREATVIAEKEDEEEDGDGDGDGDIKREANEWKRVLDKW